MSIEGTRGRWPDFVIAGAPRCGTTFLWSMLRAQDGVFMPSLKEPNFFAPDDRMGEPDQQAFGISDEATYLGLFDPAAPDDLLGEATTAYLKSRVAVPALLERSSHAKVIVTLRDPVEQISSVHGRFVASHFEDRSLGDALAPELDGDGSRPNRLLLPHTGFRGYIDAARFGEQLERLYGHLPRQRVLVVLLDDIVADPRAVLGRAADFLGIADPVYPTRARRNAHCVARSATLLRSVWSPTTVARAKRVVPRRLHPLAAAASTRAIRLIRREAPRDPVPVELRDRVRDALAADLELLGRLMGIDLVDRWWSEMAAPVNPR